jgi:hypothetical protein
MAKKDVAIKNDQPLFHNTPQVEGHGRGSETVTTDDLVIPRLEIIQDLSPQRKKSDPAYIPGAEEGMMFNTVTKKLYTEAIFVPVLFRKEWIIWKKRLAGGGFVGAYGTEEEGNKALAGLADQTIKLDDGSVVPMHELMDTHQNFGLIVDPDTGATEEIVLSFSKSKMKIGRQLNSMVKLHGGDRWAAAYKFEVVPVISDKGNYFNYKVSSVGYINESIAAVAERMYEDVSAFRKTIDRSVDVDTGDTEY